MFSVSPLDIPEVLLIRSPLYVDPRGSLTELFKSSECEKLGLPLNFVQDNLAVSKKHVLRGLHYQRAPHAQGKLIRCLHGSVFDVSVDLRKRSATFGRWVGHTLSSGSGEMLYIPEGFAHGFLVLDEEATVLYKCTREYAPGFEGGIRWDDPRIGIPWPAKNVILSEKDKHLPFLGDLQWDDVP